MNEYKNVDVNGEVESTTPYQDFMGQVCEMDLDVEDNDYFCTAMQQAYDEVSKR